MSVISQDLPSRRSRGDFCRRVDAVQTPKNDINTLILDYLTTEGYPNAAAKFAKEANLQPLQDHGEIQARQYILHAIHSGDIQSGIETLNELDPEILDDDTALHFILLRLQLVELIRKCTQPGGDITVAIKFAQEQLGPRAPNNPEFLEMLEKTMALIFFAPDNLDPSLQKLLNPELRVNAAEKVNKAILERYSNRREAAIRQLVKMRSWAETKARKDPRLLQDLPTSIDIGLKAKTDDDNPAQGENGNDMVMT